MKQSQLFPNKLLKEAPKDATAINHKLLARGRYIDQLTAGRYSFLPLGFRVWEKILSIIEQAMVDLGSQRVTTPTLHPIELWQKTNRDEAFGDEMLILDDHHGSTFALGATAEGLMTEMIKTSQPSYKDLPIVIHQFSQKFRDEKRPRGGLLRVREFMMKDAYSFHSTEKDLLKWYDKFTKSYFKIAKSFDLDVVLVEADSGAIGGDYNHEFMVLSDTGEDTVMVCSQCGYAANREKEKGKTCPECKSDLSEKKAIEWSHVFHQGQFYSLPHKATFTDKNNKQQVLWQGAYGIGIGRTLATIVETHHDEKGIIWPRSVTPYHAHLLEIGKNSAAKSLRIYQACQKAEFSVLYDDREMSAGGKFAEADLLGISVRLVISDKTGDKVEWKERSSDKVKLLTEAQLIKKLKLYYKV